MSVKPTNWFPHRPISRFPHRPMNRFPHGPMNRFPHRPPNRFPHRPTHRFPHRSTNQFLHRPMNRFPIWQLFRPKIFARFSSFISLSRKLPVRLPLSYARKFIHLKNRVRCNLYILVKISEVMNSMPVWRATLFSLWRIFSWVAGAWAVRRAPGRG